VGSEGKLHLFPVKHALTRVCCLPQYNYGNRTDKARTLRMIGASILSCVCFCVANYLKSFVFTKLSSPVWTDGDMGTERRH
jgi:hypothetical protein